ncbi:acylneuraminate cytidylyltransferase family protein [Akkermansiaceae bacterium]|nr:acylneuraminate cytidylyltransferase family protein [Akkermansiaceae bacterium]
MNVYTIIPARGGSKGVPKKNIKLLKGKPLIAYTIEYSIKSKLVNKTVVSTDAIEIANIAKSLGAKVPFMRPDHLAEDLTPDFPVFKNALSELENIFEEKIDLFILLRPTSPFRPAGLIEMGVNQMIKNPKASSLRSVAISKEHPWRQWTSNGDFIVGYDKDTIEPYNIPRQKLPEIYFQTGDIEIIRRSTIIDGSISGDHVIPLIIDHGDMVDIDTDNDWKNAENK